MRGPFLSISLIRRMTVVFIHGLLIETTARKIGISYSHSQELQNGSENSERFNNLPYLTPLEWGLELRCPMWWSFKFKLVNIKTSVPSLTNHIPNAQ